jgi:hypothetical protein
MKLSENQIRYMDRPEISETFVDSLGVVTFDGNTRLELCVTRLDPPKPPDPPHARQYPVCRVVMTPETTVALFNQLQNIMNLLQQAGLVTKQEGKPPEVIKQH